MTGYASVQHAPASTEDNASAQNVRLGLEIRAVNSRFLDLTFRLPDELRSQEPALRTLLTQRLKRGKVEVRAAIDVDASASLPQPTPALLQRMQSVQDLVQAWLPDAKALTVSDALRLAGSGNAVQVDWQEIVPNLAENAVTELIDARAREGKRLAEMLKDRLQQLRELAAQAVPLVPQLVEQQRQRFLERWQEAMGLTEGQVAPEAARERALSEATAFAIRIDVAEEITRLNSHLDEVERLLKKGGEIGKRLDFLIQEMHREANTLGSKSAALDLTRISVDMKVLIEQMREQVQNIE
ncbi:YicC/YloC family endoribonuclease [Comamonas sp. NoAH]|uniref:YicC/YloC family endoribonuclease n=1 Tax=Comamonas halotolerans TaxID=3041496 RepID=UPI0024E17715|nr:YicC/YloC family endoribonuclease [Comamonas sp. NoAH]